MLPRLNSAVARSWIMFALFHFHEGRCQATAACSGATLPAAVVGGEAHFDRRTGCACQRRSRAGSQ